MDNIEY